MTGWRLVMKNCIFDLLCFQYLGSEEIEGDKCLLQGRWCINCQNSCVHCRCYVEAEVWEECSEDRLVSCIEELNEVSLLIT